MTCPRMMSDLRRNPRKADQCAAPVRNHASCRGKCRTSRLRLRWPRTATSQAWCYRVCLYARAASPMVPALLVTGIGINSYQRTYEGPTVLVALPYYLVPYRRYCGIYVYGITVGMESEYRTGPVPTHT